MQKDTICARCGASEKSINHVFFSVHRQYKFGHCQESPQTHNYSPPNHYLQICIIYFGGFIQWWKIIILHVYYGIYGKEEIIKILVISIMIPRDTLKLAETESLLWAEARDSLRQGFDQTRSWVATTTPTNPSRWCFTDGSWKDQDNFSGQGRYSTLEGIHVRVIHHFIRRWKHSFGQWNAWRT